MSIKVAYGGVLLALNVILLTLTNIIPVNTLFIMGLASLLVSIVIMEWGFKSGIAFYIGSIVLGFIVTKIIESLFPDHLDFRCSEPVSTPINSIENGFVSSIA